METTTPDVNKDLEHRYPAAWDDDEPDPITALLADAFSPTDTDATGTDVQLDDAGFEDQVACFVEAVSEMVAKGDRGMTRLTYTGTHDGEFLAGPDAGNNDEFVECRSFRIEESEITVTNYLEGTLDLLGQLEVDLPIE